MSHASAVAVHVAFQPQVELVELVLVRAVVEGDRSVDAIARAERVERGALVEPAVGADAVEPASPAALLGAPVARVGEGTRAAASLTAASPISSACWGTAFGGAGDSGRSGGRPRYPLLVIGGCESFSLHRRDRPDGGDGAGNKFFVFRSPSGCLSFGAATGS